jgi:prevent-host-death family protein
MFDIALSNARSHFSELIYKVKAGEEVIISDKGHKIARMIPFKRPVQKRKLGTAVGRIKIHGDFNAPLPAHINKKFCL